jgi:hypothetical protein
VYQLNREPFLAAVLSHAQTYREASRIAGAWLAADVARDHPEGPRLPLPSSPAGQGGDPGLAARQPVCQAAFKTRGTIDGISVAACLLDESTARLDAVKGITPAETRLKSSDSIDPNQLSWYTTPEGSRIAEISTQGDQTGGAIVAWVIVGGADGFVINSKQFYFSDGSFTDYGIVQEPDPAYHRVATGVEYQFSIDYSHLSAAPAGGDEGYVYVPGTPVAIWQ